MFEMQASSFVTLQITQRTPASRLFIPEIEPTPSPHSSLLLKTKNPGPGEEEQRRLIKLVVLTTMNASKLFDPIHVIPHLLV
jgi:hypothetical protein